MPVVISGAMDEWPAFKSAGVQGGGSEVDAGFFQGKLRRLPALTRCPMSDTDAVRMVLQGALRGCEVPGRYQWVSGTVSADVHARRYPALTSGLRLPGKRS
eukprot:318712-Rhodomonas_salina.4